MTQGPWSDQSGVQRRSVQGGFNQDRSQQSRPITAEEYAAFIAQLRERAKRNAANRASPASLAIVEEALYSKENTQ